MKKRSPRKEGFVVGDFVEFHTQHGKTTGMIEYIMVGTKGHAYQKARITVHFTPNKIKTYYRPLFKLKKIT